MVAPGRPTLSKADEDEVGANTEIEVVGMVDEDVVIVLFIDSWFSDALVVEAVVPNGQYVHVGSPVATKVEMLSQLVVPLASTPVPRIMLLRAGTVELVAPCVTVTMLVTSTTVTPAGGPEEDVPIVCPCVEKLVTVVGGGREPLQRAVRVITEPTVLVVNSVTISDW